MKKTEQHKVEQHYQNDHILQSILDGLVVLGKDINQLAPQDLLAVDAFHIRGREATVELAEKANIQSGEKVLDIGCALGGSARFLASQFNCLVYGVDISEPYIQAATDLSRRTGLSDKVSFKQADALQLPFGSASFDVVWTEHVQMNIEDKISFYAEIARVLKPQSHLLFHDVFQRRENQQGGITQHLTYPVPWADSEHINHLVSTRRAQKLLAKVGFHIVEWQDKTAQSLEWLQRHTRKIEETPTTAIGLHLLMGDRIAEKITNLVKNIEQGNIVIVQCLAKRISTG